MIRFFILLVFCFVSIIHSLGQNIYAIYFHPKELQNSRLALSSEALSRKKKLNIAIDQFDYAIEGRRIEGLNAIVPIEAKSNWLNCALVKANEQELSQIKLLPFVSSIELIKKPNVLKLATNKFETNYSIQDYGDGYRQINTHHGDVLHTAGFQGQGMKIAVFDGGFPEVNTIKSFSHLFQENRIFPIRNIVYNSNNVFEADGHGTSVLGCMAAFIQDTIVGSAPKASYYLFITEDTRSESKQEEINWAIAAQMADSIGVDIINSSLGYHEFDEVSTNYKISDMDGRTALCSKAASIASAKGILVVNSAGNLGNKPWRIISAPADVEDVVSVGSVNRDGQVSLFSSRGLNAKNVIKPNVVAIGEGATTNFINGNYIRSNGTSFSSPIMAGLIACYWQKNSSWSANQIKKSLYESADNYWTPNRDVGFGKVNFSITKSPKLIPADSLKIGVYPNPSQNTAIVEFISDKEINESELQLFGFDKKIFAQKLYVKHGFNQVFIDLTGLSSGLYFVKVKLDNYFLSGKFEKQ